MPSSSIKQLINKFKNKEYRYEFSKARVTQGIATQIMLMRKAKDWSQLDLAERIDSKQTAVSRFENPSYGRHSLNTLFAMAEAFDVALQVKFVPFGSVIRDVETWNPIDAVPSSYEQELEKGDGVDSPVELIKQNQKVVPIFQSTSTSSNKPVAFNLEKRAN